MFRKKEIRGKKMIKYNIADGVYYLLSIQHQYFYDIIGI